MNFFIQLTCLFFLFATTLSAQDNGNQVALEVQIDELVSSKGWIAIQLLNSNKRKVASAHVNITEGKSSITFNYLEPGDYAVKFFHDENGNGQMETNIMGLPTEGYGFSNNASSFLGPPDFEDMLFTVTKDESIAIYTKY